MLTGILRDAGHTVFCAYDGLSAIELMLQVPNLSLLITNTRLGHVDGVTIDGPKLIRLARRLQPGLPILHVGDIGDYVIGVPADVPTLTEPFTADALLSLVDDVVVRRQR
jgi:CheY-like chemotaxis protein